MIRRLLLLAALVAIGVGCGKPAQQRVALLDSRMSTSPCPCPCTPTPVVTVTPTPGSAACVLTSPAARWDDIQPTPWNPTQVSLRTDDIDLYRSATGQRRLVVRLTYGYTTWSLTDPARPQLLGWHDLHAQPGYEKHGDGVSTVNAVQPSEDGQRLLVAYADGGHGTLVMPPSGNLFTFGGDFAPQWTSTGPGLAVLKSGGKYIGFSFPKGSLYSADITVPMTGAARYVPGGFLPVRMSVAGAPVTAARGLQAVSAGGVNYLVWSSINTVVIGQVTALWPTAVSWRTLTVTDLGYPSGSMLSSAVAEVHPMTGELCVMVEGQGAGASSLGVNLVGVGPATTRIIGRFQPGTSVTPATALVAGPADLLGLFWGRSADGSLKLFGLSSGSWNRDLVGAASPAASGSVNLMRGFREGSAVYLYYVSGPGALAAQMRCQ